jgi:hypothetical protein
MTGQNGRDRAVLMGSSFALGIVAGFLLKDAAKRAYTRARNVQWHRGYEETVTYDQNLPDQLARREPEPRAGQPRFGGTGALGVPPERAL